MMMVRLVNWHLRKILHKSALPDLPEVRRFMRLSFWNGFFFGALNSSLESARSQAMLAVYLEETSRQREPG